MASNNESPVTRRAQKERISVFKSDLVEIKQREILNFITAADTTMYNVAVWCIDTLLQVEVKWRVNLEVHMQCPLSRMIYVMTMTSIKTS